MITKNITAAQVARMSADTLEVLTSDELVTIKVAMNKEWENLHAAGRYDEAAAASEQMGRISDEQARRREARNNAIPQPVGVQFTNGEVWPTVVFGYSVKDPEVGVVCGDMFFGSVDEAAELCHKAFPRTPFGIYAIDRSDALNQTEGARLRLVYWRRREGRRLITHTRFFEVLPDNVAILMSEYTAEELASFLVDDKQHADTLAHCCTLHELAIMVDKTNYKTA